MAPCWRTGSPSPGVSTLMTSAPMSASSIEQNGPARMRVRSTTRIPVSGKLSSCALMRVSMPARSCARRCPRQIAGERRQQGQAKANQQAADRQRGDQRDDAVPAEAGPDEAAGRAHYARPEIDGEEVERGGLRLGAVRQPADPAAGDGVAAEEAEGHQREA